MSKGYEFEVDGGKTIKDGKSYWESNITIVFKMEYEVLRTIEQLVSQLKYLNIKNNKTITLNFPGKLIEDET